MTNVEMDVLESTVTELPADSIAGKLIGKSTVFFVTTLVGFFSIDGL